MRHHFLKSLLAAAMLALQLPALAEDIDLFVAPPPAATEVPNVLFIMDNTANWNTAFTAEMAALASTVSALQVNGDGTAKFNVGIMLFGESPVKGGYVRAAIRAMNDTNKPKYQDLINSLNKISDKGANALYGVSMAEAYRYFSALPEYVGADEPKRDYTGNTTGTAASKAVYALPGNAFSSSASKTYVNPITSSCQKNYIIFISNGKIDSSDKDDTAPASQCSNPGDLKGCKAKDLLSIAGGVITTIPLNPAGEQTSMADEWARFMKKSNLGVRTYTVDVGTPDLAHTKLLKSMAGVSGGKYFSASATSSSEIAKALESIFSEIQDVNSVFAAVSLPVSVSTQGTYLNQVYIGMFRPDPDSFPRWAGNLKQYKLGLVDNNLKLLDAGNTPAINSGTGFITGCARSFWTPSTVDSYWTFNPQGTCDDASIPNSNASNYPDGNVVEKGAQAYKLRSTISRTVKTCSPVFADCTTLTNFDNTTVSTAMLGAADATERDALINWEHGLDVDDENLNATLLTEMRPSVHGDVVHSRPTAFNYGTDASPQVVVFYGGNDGVLRAINGNRSTNIGTVTPGSELWSFVAPEFYTNIKRIRDNTTTISFPGHTSGTPTPLPKPYGVDGPVVSYKKDATNIWIYSTLRRGGRSLYSFDVTNKTTPALKWKVGCPNAGDDTGCTSGYTGIGQTWASPKVIKAEGYFSGTKPLLIMGGGYDTCEDADPNTCASPKGSMIYVLDAESGGTPLKTLSTDRSVVGDVTLVLDSDGLAKYGYAADLGGNIYRITMGSLAPASWTITKIASLGCADTSACSDNRKFIFGPDVVDDNGTYILLIGSGDREKPLTNYTHAAGVSNYFFMLKDKPTDADWLTDQNATCSADVICLGSLLAIPVDGATPTQASLNSKPAGWYLGMASTEQVVTSAITIFGVVTFSTHAPAVPIEGLCGNLGVAKVYNINYSNSESSSGADSPRWAELPKGGLPPSPVAGMVILDDGSKVPFCIGCDPDSPLEGGEPATPATATQPKSRTYWYIQQ